MLPIDYQLRMQELLTDEYGDYVKCFDAPEYRALRLNPLKTDRAQFPAFIDRYKEGLLSEGIEISLEPVEWEECGYYFYADKDVKPGNHVLHEAGAYYVQEPSAMKPASVLAARPGEKVLDLCAAPGGKSTQIAGYMEGSGVLICNEIIRSRALILSQNIERMGVRNAIVLNETPQKLRDTFVDYFDRILVDAPCSGEGMFRKNPQAAAEWSMDNVRMCAARQDEILDCAASMLKCGGTLVYSTCTFSREEDEECAARFVKRHPDHELISMNKLFPHRSKGEGHFTAEFIRKGDPAGGYCAAGDAGSTGDKRITAARRDAFDEFIKTSLKDTECEYSSGRMVCLKGKLNGRLIFFGDNLYLVPPDAPGLSGLNAVRAGLQLGTFQKDRFVPAHALAMALRPFEVRNSVNITYDEAKAYLSGMTLDLCGDKGWYLVCYEGVSMGWGKLAGGILKNHYPKGLRRVLRTYDKEGNDDGR